MRSKLLASLCPTSLFDSLYRIRARSNYQDIDAFAVGNSVAASNLQRALLVTTQYTLAVLELAIARSAGKRWLDTELMSFAATSLGAPAATLTVSRWLAMKSYV